MYNPLRLIARFARLNADGAFLLTTFRTSNFLRIRFKMKSRSNSIRPFFAGFCALFFYVATCPALYAAGDDAPASDPVWVLSYAAFIFFAGAVVMLAILFSKRRDTMLDAEEQKRTGQLRAKRATERRKEQKRAQMMAAKKKR